MTPYPTRDKIEEIFSDRDRSEIFHSYLSDHVDVEIAGQAFHLSGKYKSVDAHGAIWDRIVAIVKPETIHLEVNRVIGGGDSAWAAVYSTGTAICKSGKPFRQDLVDLVRFNTDGKVAQLKAFLDTKELHDHLDENESSQTKDETDSSQTKGENESSQTKEQKTEG